MIGRRLRQYRITASLGRGGMGEVWLARDTTLDRDVALKTLPAGDGDADAATRKERFFREARAASALNHPNIITIYEINSDQGVDFIAMEHVDGRTLADLMQHTPVAFDLLRWIARQIAEAVGEAHRAGIVHRDLKPRNIMVTANGLVKVLDFGLAKLTRAADAGNAATEAALTSVGTTVGTIGYMSPEQAIGDAVDARSDVFSFGVILYEMLTGRLPFSGPTMSDVLRQLHFGEAPALDSLRADVPASLRAVVTRALQKKPNDRFANMSDVAVALQTDTPSAAATKPLVAPAPPVPPPPTKAAWRPWHFAVAGLLVLAIAVIAIGAVRRWQTRAADVAANAVSSGAAPASPALSITPPATPPPQAAPPQAPPEEAAPKPAAATAAPAVTSPAAPTSTSAAVDPQIAARLGEPDFESQRAVGLAKLGEHKSALAVIEPLFRRQDLTGEILFRMTVVYELAGVRNRAMMSMARALRAGYPKKAFDAAPDLATLRTDPRYPRGDGPPVRPARKTPARKNPPGGVENDE